MKTKTLLGFKQSEIGLVPENWEVKSVKHFCLDITSGGTPSRNNIENWDGGKIPWLKTQELNDGNIYNTDERITEQGLNSSSAKLLPIDTVLMAMYGATVGKLGILKIQATTNQAFCAMVVNPKIADHRFLFYSLLQNRDKLINLASGAAQQNLNLYNIKEFLLPFPKLSEQKAIAKILSDLDAKIELNQKMNKTLEAIAQAIFKRWFIDFEFPDENGQPYKSSGGEMVDSELGEIPKGWDVKPLGYVLSLLKDGTHLPPKRVNKGFKFIAGATDIKHFSVDFSKCTYITEDEYLKIHKKWNIRPDDILLTIVGTLGNVAIVRERDLPFSMQRSIALLRVNEKIPYSYLYFFLNSYFFKVELQKRINPTAQPGIYLTELSKIKIIVPNKRIVDLFHSVAQSFIKFMQSRIDNSDILTDLRDTLLPKLISGRIRVPLEE